MKLLLHLFILLIGVVNRSGQSLSAQQAPTVSAVAEAQHLKLGKPIKRKLMTGEINHNTLTLEKGQLLNAIVNQRGIDTAVQDLCP